MDAPANMLAMISRDAPQEAGSFSCLLLGAEQAQPLSKQLPRNSDANPGMLRRHDAAHLPLALAATAEFTQTYGGGTVSGALSAMTTMINAVNAIYERDLGIHLTLVANETLSSLPIQRRTDIPATMPLL